MEGKEIRVRAGIHEVTRLASPTRIQFCQHPPRRLTQQRPGQFAREAMLANPVRADKEIRMRQPPPGDDVAEAFDQVMMAEDLGPGHGRLRAWSAVTRCRDPQRERSRTMHERPPIEQHDKKTQHAASPPTEPNQGHQGNGQQYADCECDYVGDRAVELA